jgi:serine phosphatase RsbU (regulator of sigma subunit)
VVAFSDGLSDAQDPSGEFFETRRILELLASCGNLDSASLHTKLMAAVSRFVEGAEPNDDVTAVIFEYAP